MRHNEKICPQNTSTWMVVAMFFMIAKCGKDTIVYPLITG